MKKSELQRIIIESLKELQAQKAPINEGLIADCKKCHALGKCCVLHPDMTFECNPCEKKTGNNIGSAPGGVFTQSAERRR
jgi:hypothetical protein